MIKSPIRGGFMERTISYGGIAPFEFNIKYTDLSLDFYEASSIGHTHNECEIYINVSGDVSFMVENNIYPISSGDIIITRLLKITTAFTKVKQGISIFGFCFPLKIMKIYWICSLKGN